MDRLLIVLCCLAAAVHAQLGNPLTSESLYTRDVPFALAEASRYQLSHTTPYYRRSFDPAIYGNQRQFWNPSFAYNTNAENVESSDLSMAYNPSQESLGLAAASAAAAETPVVAPTNYNPQQFNLGYGVRNAFGSGFGGQQGFPFGYNSLPYMQQSFAYPQSVGYNRYAFNPQRFNVGQNFNYAQRQGISSFARPQGMNSYAYPQGMNSNAYRQVMNSYARPQAMNAFPQGIRSFGYRQGTNSYAYPQGMNSYAYPQGMNAYPYSLGMNSYARPQAMNAFPQGFRSYDYRQGTNSYAYPQGMNSFAYTQGMNSYARPQAMNAFPQGGLRSYGYRQGMNAYPQGMNSYAYPQGMNYGSMSLFNRGYPGSVSIGNNAYGRNFGALNVNRMGLNPGMMSGGYRGLLNRGFANQAGGFNPTGMYSSYGGLNNPFSYGMGSQGFGNNMAYGNLQGNYVNPRALQAAYASNAAAMQARMGAGPAFDAPFNGVRSPRFNVATNKDMTPVELDRMKMASAAAQVAAAEASSMFPPPGRLFFRPLRAVLPFKK